MSKIVKFYTTTLAVIILGLFLSSCRRDPVDLLDRVPKGQSSADNRDGDVVGEPPAKDQAFTYAGNGDLASLKNLIDTQKTSASAVDAQGKSLLIYAIEGGQVNVIEYLLSLDLDVKFGGALSALENSKILSDETRSYIADLIKNGEVTAQQLTERLAEIITTKLSDDDNALNELKKLVADGADPSGGIIDRIEHPSENGYFLDFPTPMLFVALGCKFIEGASKLEIECSGSGKKPRFILALIQLGADVKAEVPYYNFDEDEVIPTTFSNVFRDIAEFGGDDWSKEDLDSILDAIAAVEN